MLSPFERIMFALLVVICLTAVANTFTQMARVIGRGQGALYLDELPRRVMAGIAALSWFKQGDTAAAEWLYREGLERSRAADHRPDIARCLSQWGVLECGRGSYSLAERYQRDALAIWQGAGNEVEIAAVQRHLGHILATAGGERGTEAGQHYADALALALRHQLAPVALDVLVGSAAHLRHTMTAGEAIELLVLAARHPASEIDTRRRAETLLAELVPGEDDWADGGAPPDVASLDWTRAAAQLAESFRHDTD